MNSYERNAAARHADLYPLGSDAIREQEQQIEYASQAAELEERDARVQEVLDSSGYDPRYAGKLSTAVQLLIGRRSLAPEQVRVLDEEGVMSARHHRKHGWNRDLGRYARQNAEDSEARLLEDTAFAREQFSLFTVDQVVTLEIMLSESKRLSPFIAAQKPEEVAWVDWLSPVHEDESVCATNEQFMNVMQWHADYVANLRPNTETGEAARETLRNNYKNGVESAIEKGLLPAQAQAKLDKLNDVPVRFTSLFDSARYNQPNHYDIKRKVIALWDADDSATAAHEFNHAVLGSLRIDGDLATRWIDEAVTEYVAQCIDDPESATLAGNQDMDSNPYGLERQALAAVIEGTNGRVTALDVVGAYVDQDLKTLQEKLEAAYNNDVIGNICLFINSMWQHGIENMTKAENSKYTERLLLKALLSTYTKSK